MKKKSIDWDQIEEDLENVSFPLHWELGWVIRLLRDRKFRALYEDHFRYCMCWLAHAKKRVKREGCEADDRALEATKGALLQYAKKRGWDVSLLKETFHNSMKDG